MSKLTNEERNKIPSSEFAGPDRSYPVNDREHAINAKARSTQMHDKGLISMRAEELIHEKANRVLENKG